MRKCNVYVTIFAFLFTFYVNATYAQELLKVVTYNTHGGHGNLTLNLEKFNELLDGDEQVLCLQELSPSNWSQVQAAFPDFPYTYAVWQRTTDFQWPWETREWSGGAILSKLPILERKQALIQIDPGGDLWQRKAAWVKLQVAGSDEGVYLAHYHNTYNWNLNDFESEREGMTKFRDFILSELNESSLNITTPQYVLAGDYNLFQNEVNDVLFDTPYHYGDGRDHQNANILMLDTKTLPTRNLDISDHNAVTVTYDKVVQQPVTDNTHYYMQNRYSGLYMEVKAHDETQSPNNIQQAYYRGDARQRFVFTTVSEGIYHITSAYSGFSLDIASRSADDGSNVIQWEYNDQTNQQFSLSLFNDSYYKISPIHNDKLIEVGEWSVDEGGNIQQWQDINQSSAHWYLIPVSIE